MPHINIFGRGFKLRAAITIACQMAFILFGYDQGVFSGIVGNENFLDTFGHPSPSLEGIIVSIYNLGCFSGCILSFIFCEKTGRRLAMWIAMIFIIVRLLPRYPYNWTFSYWMYPFRLVQSSRRPPLPSRI